MGFLDLIHVRFVDSETDRVFAESWVPADQLPSSFEADTTLHLGESDWRVVEARPMTAAEFRRSGKLLVKLQKVTLETIDPRKLLYSLATINDDLPGIQTGTSKLSRDVLEIHEDDWRQVEWVSESHGHLIEQELAAIHRIYEEERVEVADPPMRVFRTLHVRKLIPSPLEDVGILIEDLVQSLPPKLTHLDGIAFHGVAGIVDHSFALRLLSSIEIYGLVVGERPGMICFGRGRLNNTPQPDVDHLAAFAARHKLILVDWCRAQTVVPSPGDYAEYFVSGADRC